ncbi:MAG: homocysteine S-methyltransferase family protein [Faecousia sp.]
MNREEFAALCSTRPLLLDGATGSNLMKRGMPRGVCTELWIDAHPEILLDLQREYVAAGSDIIYAPTFSANRHTLQREGLGDQVSDLNRRLVALSRQAAGGKALVAGDMTTTGIPLEPNGPMEYNRLHEIYREQAAALAEGGADLIVIETMLGIDETAVALEAAREVCDLPVLCSLTVQSDGSAYFGGNCVDAVEELQELGASAAGVNCSCGPEQLVSLVRNMKAVARIPLLVKPNAGMPAISDDGEAVYPMTAAEFAAHMRVLQEAGANLIGGCCGTTPEFIAEMKRKLL